MADYGFFSPAAAQQLLADVRALKAAVFGSGGMFTPRFPAPKIYVHNVSGEEIPAYACMQTTGTESISGRTYIQVDKPADVSGEAGGYLFNGPRAIAIDKNGVGFAGPHVQALGDGGTATAGKRWGPQASSWEVAESPSGFLICIGDDADAPATDVVRFVYSYGFGLVHFQSPSGGIPAFASNTMGSASCDIYESSDAGVLSDSLINDTIYHMATNAFAGSKRGIAARNDAGLLVAIVEDCGAA